ncbi:MAG: peptidase [Azospirillaceae bacterium]
MTYCLGIRVEEGLIALSDGRVTAGSQIAAAKKMTVEGEGADRFFIMTSGLRSVRDKALSYMRRRTAEREGGMHREMIGVVDCFARSLRQVADEDQAALERSELIFNLHAIVGGKLQRDRAPTMYLVYPEGNWIEVDERTPYLSIGSTAYGKPILDRALRFETELRHALKLAYLSFDSTRFSSTDVGFPIDLLTYAAKDAVWRQDQFDYDDLVEQRQWWNENITRLARQMPDGPWMESLLPGATAQPIRLRPRDQAGDD